MHPQFLIVLAISFPSWSLVSNPAYAEALSRAEAIQIALVKNPEVIAARQEWRAAKARATQARALPDPELELEYEEVPELNRLGDFAERAVGITQLIESPLKWRRRSRAADQSARAVRLAVFEMTKVDISTRVKVAYDRVLLQRKRLGYIEQSLKLSQDFLKKARLRLQAGDVAQLEVLRAEVEEGRAANRLTEVRSNLSVARAELNALLARKDRAALAVRGELSYQPVSLELDVLYQWAQERRPDLRSANWALKSARSEQAAVRAAWLPDLSLGLFRQTIRTPAGEDDSWRVGLALEIPLWGAARQRGELAEAGAITKRVKAERHNMLNQALLDIEIAYLNVRTAEKQLLLFQDRIVRVAEHTVEVAGQSYQEGKATYLALLEAQRALAEVREEYAEALFNYRWALSTLERAVGGDLPAVSETSIRR
jgi:outer membrane protein TolC